MQEIHHYDIVVIGSGPAGEKAALQASKLKKQVALIEKITTPGWSLSSHRHNSLQISKRNCDAFSPAASANTRN